MYPTTLTVGIIGCGNVGNILAQRQNAFRITAAYDCIPERAQEYSEKYGAKPLSDFSEFLAEPVDIVVEAASVSAVREHAIDVLLSGKDMIILSVGALAEETFRTQLLAKARHLDRKIHIPSGAIMGLDNIRIGQISRVDTLFLKTTKNPKSLGIAEQETKCVFSGTASDCVRQYPKNTNVAISLSLACGCDANVELWSNPGETKNMHEITFAGEFGDAYIRIRNNPAPDNAATSSLAALSILSILENLKNPLVIGA
ncbi:aspartate dehydrogenase [Methanogenium organophilum]|uniref:L-aspartate dehydrogenase n=1 Tax=Methanogenium organophilum TaxID=2199 RepID=A0A9X9S4B6_METOG|nr:aspartate dehydrogenase [Methanogenium organophilum]WAI01426.1 aspartate dehydrogenase [Methanogenium organophilum]